MTQPYSTGPCHIFVGVGGGVIGPSGGYVPPARNADAPTLNLPAIAASTGGVAGGFALGAVRPPVINTDGYHNTTNEQTAQTFNSATQRRARQTYERKPVYLGTCEDCPRVTFRPFTKPVRTDWSCEEADDVSFLGEEAIISAALNRYNEQVYLAMAARPAFYGSHGTSSRFDRGTLMRRAGLTYPVWLLFPYYAKNAMSAGGMPPGYRFIESYIEGDTLESLGTKTKMVGIVWRAIRQQRGVLYDHDMTGLPVIT